MVMKRYCGFISTIEHADMLMMKNMQAQFSALPVRGFVAFLALFGVMAVLGDASAAEIARPVQFKHAKAPVFSAQTLDGKTISSKQLAGKAYIVNFFASWCPPCRAEIPDMVALQKVYQAKGFTFIGVAVNENDKSIRNFVKSSGINYPVVMANQQLVAAFSPHVSGGMSVIPTSFVINRSGQVTQVVTGARNKAVFEKMILEALKPVQ